MTTEGVDPASREHLAPEFVEAWENMASHAIDNMQTIGASANFGSIRRLVSGAVRQPQSEEAREVAHKLYRQLNPMDQLDPNPDPSETRDFVLRGAIEAMTTAYTVDALKVATIGPETTSRISNGIINSANDMLALDIVAKLTKHGTTSEAIADAAYELMAHAEMSVRHHPSSTVAWLFPKLKSFGGTLYNAAHILDHQNDGLDKMTAKEIKLQASENNEMFQLTKSLQRYGLKTAIAPAVDTSSTEEWIVFDAFEMNKEAGGVDHDRLTNASFIGSTKRFSSGKPQLYVMESDSATTARYYGVNVHELLDDTDNLSITFSLDTRGQLVCSGSTTPLEPFFKRIGKLAEYEELRSQALSIYFDLVTPVYVQAVVDQEAATIKSSNPSFSDIRRLVLARTRVLKVLKSDIEQALETDVDTPRGYINGLAQHDVINHIRMLPPGYRASDAARQACFKDTGIILADEGETYVRPHKRGNVEVGDKGHRAAYNVGAMATKQSK